jgi:molybdate transport system substrate-binding protein
LITPKDSGTAVTGFADLANAQNMALADGSVPAGRYAREVLISLGILDGSKAAADYTTEEVSAALGGLEINECSNVSKVKEAVKEGSNEVGAVYYSDAYSIKDAIDVIEIADSTLTGDILYPVCRIVNSQATEAESAAADDFIAFLQTDAAKTVFRKLYVYHLRKKRDLPHRLKCVIRRRFRRIRECPPSCGLAAGVSRFKQLRAELSKTVRHG